MLNFIQIGQTDAKIWHQTFLARDVAYISRLCHDASPFVRLSVCD